MKIILAATEHDRALGDAWERFCGDLDGVAVHRGSILDLDVDAVVSPANGFGFMDGGIDLLYSRAFGWNVQERLQRAIRERHHGELLVGAAEIVETGHPRISYVIAAPTMRVPMILRDSVNPYLAARAALLLVRHGRFAEGALAGEPIARAVETVAFPGLGTGVGRVGPATCARQVRAAIEEVAHGRSTFPTSWADAQARHQLLYGDRVTDLQVDE
jgi:O-acetyl-ADP-ribose deacetylase (regulator of RNase III)